MGLLKSTVGQTPSMLLNTVVTLIAHGSPGRQQGQIQDSQHDVTRKRTAGGGNVWFASFEL